MKWSKGCVSQLIDEYKKRDVIWNQKTEHFNKMKKQGAWEEIDVRGRCYLQVSHC
jgi:hypothetical protein